MAARLVNEVNQVPYTIMAKASRYTITNDNNMNRIKYFYFYMYANRILFTPVATVLVTVTHFILIYYVPVKVPTN